MKDWIEIQEGESGFGAADSPDIVFVVAQEAADRPTDRGIVFDNEHTTSHTPYSSQEGSHTLNAV